MFHLKFITSWGRVGLVLGFGLGVAMVGVKDKRAERLALGGSWLFSSFPPFKILSFMFVLRVITAK